jgi:acyl dehydratase
MVEESHLTPELMACVGRTGPKRSIDVTERDIYRFSLSTGDKNPLWRDEEFAKDTPNGGIVAPPFFTTTVALEEEEIDELEESGIGSKMGLKMAAPAPGFIGAIATSREMEFGVPIRPGDTITVQEKIVDIYEKHGRLGPMIFIVSEFTYTNQRGEVAVRERSAIIRHR